MPAEQWPRATWATTSSIDAIDSTAEPAARRAECQQQRNLLDSGGERRGHEGRDHAPIDRSQLTGRDVEPQQDVAGVLGQAVSRRRQTERASFEQGDTERGFQRRHLLADRRLRVAERRRCAGERAVFDDGNEGAEQADIHDIRDRNLNMVDSNWN